MPDYSGNTLVGQDACRVVPFLFNYSILTKKVNSFNNFPALVNLPLAAFLDKAFGVYFEQAAVFTRHFNHVGKRVYFGDAEVGAVVEDVDSFVWQTATGFVVPVNVLLESRSDQTDL